MSNVLFSESTSRLKDSDEMSVKKSGNYTQAKGLSGKRGQIECYIRISKDEYVVVNQDGEILRHGVYNNDAECKKIENVKKTLERLEIILKGNFNGGENELFITLTYNRHMNDVKKLYKDFSLFWKRFVGHYKKYNLEYVRVIEASDSGSLHVHLFVKATNTNIVRIGIENIRKIWNHGSVDKKVMYEIRGFIIYVCNPYITKKPLHRKIDDLKESMCKAERVNLYPKDLRIYTKSSGIDGIVKSKEKCKNIKDDVEKYGGEIVSFDIKDEFKNVIYNQVTIAEYMIVDEI